MSESYSLINALRNSDLETAKRLIKAPLARTPKASEGLEGLDGVSGVDLDVQKDGGWTPLMFACVLGYVDIAKLLIEAPFGAHRRPPKVLVESM